jgi:hypothetical protein
LVIVKKDGTVTWEYSRPDGGNFMKATKLENGDVACVIQQQPGTPSRYIRFDFSAKAPKEVASFGVNVIHSGGRIDVLANGNVVVAENSQNRVVEYDTASGGSKIAWQVEADSPIYAVRLRNGHTLVTSMNVERGAVEIDREGKARWQYHVDTRVTRAYRR